MYYRRRQYYDTYYLDKIYDTRNKQRIYRITGKYRLARYIVENEIFSKNDIDYIKSIPDYEFKNKNIKIMTRQKLIEMYELPRLCNNIMNMVNYLSENKSDEQIKKAKEAINISNKESYLSNLGLGKQ